MKLTVLGSSSAIFNPKTPYRYPASHLVEADGIKILLDAGIGVMPQLAKLGMVITDVSVIAISHFHADHFTLQPLLQAYFLEGKFGGHKATLHILGPTGIEERARIGFDQSGFSYADDFLPNVDVRYSEYDDKQKIEIAESLVLTPFKTLHFGLDAYALRLENDATSLAYSGDSTVSDGLEAAAQKTDIFLCEAFTRVGGVSDQGHLTPHDAAALAARAQTKQLVLTHYSGFDEADSILAEANTADFGGVVAVANDLDSYEA